MPFRDKAERRGTGAGVGFGNGKGRMSGNNAGAGPGGYCVCPQCGEKVSHIQGKPCFSVKCPKCGEQMMRG